MIPIKIDRPVRTTPLVNYALIATNVGVALVLAASPSLQGWAEKYLFLWPTAGWIFEGRVPVDQADPHLWQFITYQFMHDQGGIWHLLFNMVFLWVFGNALEDRLGSLRYLLFYLAGGVMAGIGHVLVSDAPVIGASGAIAAVTGAFLALFPHTRVRVLVIFFIITFWDIPSMWLILFFFGKDVFFLIGGGGSVAYMAHIGGTVFGFAVGMFLLFTRLLPREPYDMMTMFAQWNRRRKFAAIARKGYDPWKGRAQNASTPFREDPAAPKDASTETPGDTPEDVLARQRAEISTAILDGRLDDAATRYPDLLADHPEVVLSQDNQLTLANHLFSRGDYQVAADAYRLLLKTYPGSDPHGRVHLVFGLTLVRYLDAAEEAVSLLRVAHERAHHESDRELARDLLLEAGQTLDDLTQSDSESEITSDSADDDPPKE